MSIICLYVYSLFSVIRFEANQSEPDPFIRFEANKYSLRYSLLFASKRINIRFDIRFYLLRSKYRRHPTLTPSLGAQEPVLQCSTPHFEFICASLKGQCHEIFYPWFVYPLSNYNKIVCFAGVNDTGEAPEKSNIFMNIRKKSKSLLGLSTGARRSCLKKKTKVKNLVALSL